MNMSSGKATMTFDTGTYIRGTTDDLTGFFSSPYNVNQINMEVKVQGTFRKTNLYPTTILRVPVAGDSKYLRLGSL